MRAHLRCHHGVLEDEREPLDPTTPTYGELLRVLADDQTISDFQLASHLMTTSSVEAFQSLSTTYRPKRRFL